MQEPEGWQATSREDAWCRYDENKSYFILSPNVWGSGSDKYTFGLGRNVPSDYILAHDNLEELVMLANIYIGSVSEPGTGE